MLSSPAKANHVPMLAANQGWLKPALFFTCYLFGKNWRQGFQVRRSSVFYRTALLSLRSPKANSTGKSVVLVWFGHEVLLETYPALGLMQFETGGEL